MKANKVNQYRVGNIVTSGGEPLIVESILGGTLRLYLHSLDKEILFEFPVDQIVGLPLSEEWLIKCKRPYWLFKDHQDAYWFSFGGHKREIKFVHQLQNANYVLEGKELEFKL